MDGADATVLASLPIELWTTIVSFMQPGDAARFGFTCRAARKIVGPEFDPMNEIARHLLKDSVAHQFDWTDPSRCSQCVEAVLRVCCAQLLDIHIPGFACLIRTRTGFAFQTGEWATDWYGSEYQKRCQAAVEIVARHMGWDVNTSGL